MTRNRLSTQNIVLKHTCTTIFLPSSIFNKHLLIMRSSLSGPPGTLFFPSRNLTQVMASGACSLNSSVSLLNTSCLTSLTFIFSRIIMVPKETGTVAEVLPAAAVGASVEAVSNSNLSINSPTLQPAPFYRMSVK